MYERESPCLEWRGCTNAYGYGVVRNHEGKVLQVHRVAYEAVKGPIPDGLVLDHLCRNTVCMNPGHLEPVTRGENVRRGENNNRKKTHCIRGHEFTGHRDNTGQRVCLECRRIRYHEAKAAK